MKLLKVISHYSIVYLILLFACFLSLTLVAIIPNESIKENISRSLPLLEKEGKYPVIGGDFSDYMLDNFTDSIMLNIIYNIDNSHPISSVLSAKWYWGDLSDMSQFSPVTLLATAVNEYKNPNGQYTRYWHGYMTLIRPLLVFASYTEIRKIYEFILLLLFGLVFALSAKRISWIFSVFFLTSLVCVNFIIIPFSLQFSSLFIIAFISMIIILSKPNFPFPKLVTFFFIIGGLTSFTDFLTTPIITFGFPAIVSFILLNHENDFSLKRILSWFFYIGLAWIMGYASIWISKWLLATIFLGDNYFAEGFQTVLLRTSGAVPNSTIDKIPLGIHAIIGNLKRLYQGSTQFIIIVLGFIGLSFIFIFPFWHHKKKFLLFSLSLFGIASVPYFWYAFVANHSLVHTWFTYRGQVISILALLCATYYSINWEKIKLDMTLLSTRLKNRQIKHRLN